MGGKKKVQPCAAIQVWYRQRRGMNAEGRRRTRMTRGMWVDKNRTEKGSHDEKGGKGAFEAEEGQ